MKMRTGVETSPRQHSEPLISPALRRKFVGGIAAIIGGLATIPGIVWLDGVMQDHYGAQLREHRDAMSNVGTALLKLEPVCIDAFYNPDFKAMEKSARYEAIHQLCGGQRSDFGNAFSNMLAMEAYVESAEIDLTAANTAGVLLYLLPLGGVAAGAFLANGALAESSERSSRNRATMAQAVSSSTTVVPPVREAETDGVPSEELPARIVIGSGGGPMCFIDPCPGPTRAIFDA